MPETRYPKPDTRYPKPETRYPKPETRNPGRSGAPGAAGNLVPMYRAAEPGQWLQRHPEAGSSWPSWSQVSQGTPMEQAVSRGEVASRLHEYLALKKTPAPEDHHRALGIVLLYGPRGKQLLMSEVPLYFSPTQL